MIMETLLDKAHRAAEAVRLSAAEKDSLRQALMERMAQPVSVSWTARLRAAWRGIALSFSRPALAFTALAGLIAVGSGTVVAAESSLPGETLYGVKVSVTEPLLGAMAVTPEARAQWSVEMVNRRLSEAETLAERGQLIGSKKSEMERRLEQDAAAATQTVADLGRNEHLPVAAAVLGSELETSLRARGQRLGRSRAVAPSGRGAVEADDRPETVASVAARAADAATDVRESEEQRLADTAAVSAEAVRARITAVERRIDRVRSRLDSKGDVLDDETVADATDGLSEAEAAIAAGREKLRNGDTAGAFASVQQADRSAQEAELHVLQTKSRSERRGDLGPGDGERGFGAGRGGRDGGRSDGRNED